MTAERFTPPPARRFSPPGGSALGLCLLAAFGCGGGDLVLPSDGGAAALAATTGAGQNGTAGEALANPIVVKVTDAQGQPVSGARVAFAPDATAGGSISPDTVSTKGDGLASASWILGGKAGTQTANATIVGQDGNDALSESFTATVAAASAQSLGLLSGDNQSAAPGTALTDPLVVVVTDRFGNPVEGIRVSWEAEGGSVNPGSATSGADGQASTLRVLGSSAGTQHATASVRGLDGSPVTFTQSATGGSAPTLVIVSGNNQQGSPGAALAAPLVVQLTDGQGHAIAGTSVTWAVETGGGSIQPGGSTDGDGKASATFTLGATPGGRNIASATVAGIGPVEFTARASGGGGTGPSASNSSLSADPSSIQALSGTATITVLVRDGNNAPLSGVTVLLSASGSGNTLTQPGAQTGADGIATGALASAVPGTKVIHATANGVQISQTAEVIVTLAPATTLTIVAGDGQTADAGSKVGTAPSVRVTNDLGQGIAGFGVTFVVTGGNGSVTGSSQTTNSNGFATVGSWTLGDPGTNTLEARAEGLNGNPAVFTATANGTGGGNEDGDHLVFQVQPANPQVRDRDFTPAIVVAVVDAAGNVVRDASVDIHLSLRSGADSGPKGKRKLDGRETRKTEGGVAIFDDLKVKDEGASFALTATASRRPELGQAVSNSFDVNHE